MFDIKDFRERIFKEFLKVNGIEVPDDLEFDHERFKGKFKFVENVIEEVFQFFMKESYQKGFNDCREIIDDARCDDCDNLISVIKKIDETDKDCSKMKVVCGKCANSDC